MIGRFRGFLGVGRWRALMVLLVVTGVGNILASAFGGERDWVQPVQTLLVLAFIGGAGVIVGSRAERPFRARLMLIFGPAFGLVVLGLLALSGAAPAVFGGALGWVLAATLVFRDRSQMEYRLAVKHLRKGEYGAAVKMMDVLVKSEPDDENHYRFRAEILRMWGKLDKAQRDYRKMAEIAPESAVAFNGLAEVYLQAGDYQQAREAGLRAYELAPDEWVAAYNLGMIEDRLVLAQDAVEHLERALRLKVPDARHRLLIYLYLARAHTRLGAAAAAEAAVENLKREGKGLNEWQKLLENEQAAALRAVLEDDVRAAQGLVDGQLTVEALE